MSATASSGLYQVLAGNAMLLVVATTAITTLKDHWNKATHIELVQRVRTWWIIFAMFALNLLTGRVAFLTFMGMISFLALKEYFSLIATRPADRYTILLAYLAVPVQYLFIGLGIAPGFMFLVPVVTFLVIQGSMVLRGEANDYVHAAGQLQWGIVICLSCISHLAYLRVLPAEPGGAGLVFYVVLLTELNDIAQYLWGKLAGRNKVSPRLSPNKTWEGLIGGIATTIVLAIALAQFVTPFSTVQAMAAGAVIAAAGFFGDLNISALKRDLGVKDTGQMLPGHGGILDRLDSLMFTAPAFFYFYVLLSQGGHLS
jgi:phosphatidate cytidylyltransferase